MSAQTPQKFTLEEISLRKKKLLNEIHAQKKAMTATTREIFAPIAPANNKSDEQNVDACYNGKTCHKAAYQWF